MVKLSKRIEELRTEKGMSRYQLCQAMGFPKMTIDKFETGRLTPTKQQLEKLAAYFGVTADYISGENDDTITQWIIQSEREEARKAVPPAPKKTVKQSSETQGSTNSMMDAFTGSELFRQAVLEVLKSPEGIELIRKAMRN